MFYVYVLKSKRNNSLYIGFTSDLRRRFVEHNQGLSNYTKKLMPWELIYYEAYRAKFDAIIRERRLKQFKNSYIELKKRIAKSLDALSDINIKVVGGGKSGLPAV